MSLNPNVLLFQSDFKFLSPVKIYPEYHFQCKLVLECIIHYFEWIIHGMSNNLLLTRYVSLISHVTGILLSFYKNHTRWLSFLRSEYTWSSCHQLIIPVSPLPKKPKLITQHPSDDYKIHPDSGTYDDNSNNMRVDVSLHILRDFLT